ncbi:alpha 1,2-mannosyltransferase 2.4.1 [Borealophlyctis nickersoniae]|nr:alpha 1,2-mannosyltransferase 2.4.1 [Borealophlyctis nickersoniae]
MDPTSPPPTLANATIVALVRNKELKGFLKTLSTFEPTFNSKYNYPYTLLNDEPFTENFKNSVRNATKARVEFGLIPEAHWSHPEWIDKKKSARRLAEMAKAGVLYGGLESYRHMCRYNSGFFFRHELMQKYRWYWRIEPDVEYHCTFPYDPFHYMIEHNKTYAYNIIGVEFMSTVNGLWNATKSFMKKRKMKMPLHLKAFWDKKKDDYNGVHFWSNFEIADLEFFRSKDYIDYFNYLDKAGGFFYERWGDAPIHSLATGLFLNVTQLHYFDDIGYTHIGRTHCPADLPEHGIIRNCTCKPVVINDWWQVMHDRYMKFINQHWTVRR